MISTTTPLKHCVPCQKHCLHATDIGTCLCSLLSQAPFLHALTIMQNLIADIVLYASKLPATWNGLILLIYCCQHTLHVSLLVLVYLNEHIMISVCWRKKANVNAVCGTLLSIFSLSLKTIKRLTKEHFHTTYKVKNGCYYMWA